MILEGPFPLDILCDSVIQKLSFVPLVESETQKFNHSVFLFKLPCGLMYDRLFLMHV